MKNSLDRYGFTLIELVIAISIVAITLAISGPALGQYTRTQRVKSVAREIYTNLQLARMTAIKENNKITATFVLQGPAFMSLTREDNTDVIPGVSFYEDSPEIILTSTRQEADGGGVIPFTSTGTLYGNSTQTISVSYDDQDITTIYKVVVGSTGGIRFKKDEK
jgi:prepilin-type N-terminal cleavage/methylation domain-containing protein